MSTTTSLAGSPPSLSGHLSPSSPPRDPLTNGLRTLFDPTIRTTTEKLWSVRQSQEALSHELKTLISQLNFYLETTDPPALKPTIIKLASVGKRLGAVNAQLHQIQARVKRLLIQLSKQRANTNSNAVPLSTTTTTATTTTTSPSVNPPNDAGASSSSKAIHLLSTLTTGGPDNSPASASISGSRGQGNT